MNDQYWTVLNDLEEAFSQTNTFAFLLEELQLAVDNNDTQLIIDTTAALNAFLPVYTHNWDRKFKIAWNRIIK